MDEEIKEASLQDSEDTSDQRAMPQDGEVYTLQDPEEEIARLKAQVEEFKDKYLRVYAEIDNMKKRMARDKQEIIKYGSERLLREFLFVYDAVEKALHTAKEKYSEEDPLVQGLRMTEKLFLETLKKHQVEPIEAKNTAFDPNYHEALMQVQDTELQKGMVVHELEKGFMLHDRVLRPAKVTVSG